MRFPRRIVEPGILAALFASSRNLRGVPLRLSLLISNGRRNFRAQDKLFRSQEWLDRRSRKRRRLRISVAESSERDWEQKNIQILCIFSRVLCSYELSNFSGDV